MKRVLLLFLTLAMFNVGRAQTDHTVLEDPFFRICMNDTLLVQAVITCAQDKGTVFRQKETVETADGIVVFLAPNQYIMYVPDLCTTFTVQCTCGTHYSVSAHLVWLIKEVRKNRSTIRQYVRI